MQVFGRNGEPGQGSEGGWARRANVGIGYAFCSGASMRLTPTFNIPGNVWRVVNMCRQRSTLPMSDVVLRHWLPSKGPRVATDRGIIEIHRTRIDVPSLRKPAFRAVFQVVTTRADSGVILIKEPPDPSQKAPSTCSWWRRGRVEPA